MNLLGYHITPYLPKVPVSQQIVINTINPHSYCVAKKDKEFSNALHKSDYLLPDGIGIVLAAKWLKGKKIQKIAGNDVFLHLMNQLNESKGSCFFLGAAPNTLDKIKEKAAKEFPKVKVHSYSPPYKQQFSAEDNDKMCTEVNTIKPDVLFVGMTAPKQEKWVFNHKEQLDAKIICSIGAVFDFYAGTVKRPSNFWINLKLEWFIRFMKEPKRLFKRNFVSTPTFLWDVFLVKIGFKK